MESCGGGGGAESNGVKTLFQQGIVKHAFGLLEVAVKQDTTYEAAVVPLLELLSELAGFADGTNAISPHATRIVPRLTHLSVVVCGAATNRQLPRADRFWTVPWWRSSFGSFSSG
jgi:hypothetical protein